MPNECYNCWKEGDMKRCTGCQHAMYCSKTCQKAHWKKHKQNCLPPESSVHKLFDAIIDDILPVPVTVGREYGFDNMRLYHGDVLWGDSSTPLSAEQILLGLFKFITSDVAKLEEGGTITMAPFNSIGASKKMIVEAYEKNALDELFIGT